MRLKKVDKFQALRDRQKAISAGPLARKAEVDSVTAALRGEAIKPIEFRGLDPRIVKVWSERLMRSIDCALFTRFTDEASKARQVAEVTRALRDPAPEYDDQVEPHVDAFRYAFSFAAHRPEASGVIQFDGV